MIEAMKSLSVNANRVRSENGSAKQDLATGKAQDSRKASVNEAIKNADEEKDSTQQLQELIKELNEQADKLSTNIAFALSDETERLYVKVLERNTGKVIREFPSEQARALTGYLKSAVGLLFDKES